MSLEDSENWADVPEELGKSRAAELADLASLLPKQPETIARDPVEQRCGEALHDLDFEYTPELLDNLREFYADQYNLAQDIEQTLDETNNLLDHAELDQQKTELQAIIDTSPIDTQVFEMYYKSALEYGNMPPNITRLIRPFLARIRLDRLDDPNNERLKTVELMLLAVSTEALFAEASVAVSSVGAEERNLVKELAGRVQQRMTESPNFSANGQVINPPDMRRSINTYFFTNPEVNIDKAQKVFWNDCRYAGQLLFHNSSDMPTTRQRAKLMPRRMQEHVNGEMRFGTAESVDGHLHSPMIHWSEVYAPDEYKGGGARSTDGGTIAMPLWKIIHAAPYGRDSHYGILRVKPDRLDQFTEKVRLIDTPGSIGSGDHDQQGMTGTDRTFYSSPHDVAPDAPIEEAPDGHAFELTNDDYAVILGDREAGTAMLSGLGEGFPQLYSMDTQDFPDDASWNSLTTEQQNEFRERRNSLIRDGVRNLQHQSAAKRPAEFVVPLRSGIFDFEIGDDGKNPGRPRANFNRLPATPITS